MNLNFVFQGCQILMVRVAISRSDVIAQTQFQHRMMAKLPAYNTPLSESMGSFVIPFSLLCPELCRACDRYFCGSWFVKEEQIIDNIQEILISHHFQTTYHNLQKNLI